MSLLTAGATVGLTSVARPASASGVPLPVIAASAPAVASVGVVRSKIVVVRTADSRLFYTISNAAGTEWAPSGWQEIPGGGRSPFAPAVTETHGAIGRAHVAIVGMNGRSVFTQSVDIGPNPTSVPKWQGSWQEMPGGGQFVAGPEIVRDADSAFTVLAPGLSGAVHLAGWSWQYGYFGNWQQTIPGMKTTHEVAAAPHFDWEGFKILVVARAADGSLQQHWVEKDTNTSYAFGQTSTVPGGGKTDHAPAMDAGGDGAITLVVRGVDDGLAYQTFFISKWHSGWKFLDHPGNTHLPPAVEVDKNVAQVYVVGQWHAVYQQRLFRGLNDSGPDVRTWIPGIPAGWGFVPLSIPPGPTPPPEKKPDLGFASGPYIDLSEKRIYITFKNSGNADAGGFRVHLLVNNALYDHWIFSGMAPGATQTIYADVTYLSAQDTYSFVLDPYGVVDESNEGNNQYNGYLATVPVVE